MEAFAGLVAGAVLFIGIAVFLMRGTMHTLNGIGRTTKAIGEWNKEKLGEK